MKKMPYFLFTTIVYDVLWALFGEFFRVNGPHNR